MNLETSPVATALIIIAALVGAALVILSAVGHVDPALRISFDQYLKAISVAFAGLAVGRGLVARKKT